MRRCVDVNPRPKVDYEKIAQRQITGIGRAGQCSQLLQVLGNLPSALR